MFTESPETALHNAILKKRANLLDAHPMTKDVGRALNMAVAAEAALRRYRVERDALVNALVSPLFVEGDKLTDALKQGRLTPEQFKQAVKDLCK